MNKIVDGDQVGLNSDGKIQMEETANESIINAADNSNVLANISESTMEESQCSVNTSNPSNTTDAEDNSKSPESTAAVLSIDDHDNGEFYKNHLINNNINNNNNNNHIQNTVGKMDDGSNAVLKVNTTDTSDSNDKTNDANGDVLNNDIDSDNKRLSNNTNSDAANSVGFCSKLTVKKNNFFFLFCHLSTYQVK